LKWGPTSTNGQQRVYHYYCPDTTTRVQFVSPRVEVCDGNEPTIQTLLGVPQNRWTDLSGNNFHAGYQGTTTLPTLTNGDMVFGSNNWMSYGIVRTSANNIGQTWEAVVTPNSNANAGIYGHVLSGGCTYYCNGGICIWNGNYAFNWYDNANYQFLVTKYVISSQKSLFFIFSTYFLKICCFNLSTVQ
jgi:hypothetical protein